MPAPETVTELFAHRAREHPDRVAIRTLAEGGGDRPGTLTWHEWEASSRSFAASLVEAGLEPGDRVAVFAGNRPLWPIADLGTVAAGCVGVGLYPSSAPSQVRQVLADSGASVLVVDTTERFERVAEVRDELPALRTVVVRDGAEEDGRTARRGEEGVADSTVRWDDWLARGAEAMERGGREELERRADSARSGDTAVLIYTSGSTGEPKGARISHRCLIASAESIRDTLGLGPDDTTLSFLPFCHAAERIFGLYTRLLVGMEAALVEDVGRLWEAAVAYRPTLFGGLPRFYEKIHAGVRGGRTGEEAGGPGEGRCRWEDFLGDRVRLATSGGATLPEAVSRELHQEGLTVLGAYGLTEHLCVAFNRPDRFDLTTSGPPMPGTELRIADDGEILVRRGPLTFDGYQGRPEATRAAFTEDGVWLKTGDLGELTEDGFLRVTGRKKELLALSTGKMVAPVPIERALAGDPAVERAVVLGEGRKFVSALLVPAGRPDTDAARAETAERLRAAVARVNRDLSRTESVRRFLVAERPLSEADGEVTPTGKVRRARVEELWRDRIEALYRGEEGIDVVGGARAGSGPGEAP